MRMDKHAYWMKELAARKRRRHTVRAWEHGRQLLRYLFHGFARSGGRSHKANRRRQKHFRLRSELLREEMAGQERWVIRMADGRGGHSFLKDLNRKIGRQKKCLAAC